MRLAICSIGLVLSAAVLVGCGQSGNLQLANSPDSDKRVKYLLYSKHDNTTVQAEKKTVDQAVPADQSAPASQVTSN
ncbi:hypothetical protein ACG9YX_02165 [Acinetobacter nematophilus]|uniref:hypothetical protein n=1 Tax=Acinetobacter nematophilus TaxID=2994642 RepID=UPI003AF6467C